MIVLLHFLDVGNMGIPVLELYTSIPVLEEDRVGGNQGTRVPEEVVDGPSNFKVGVLLFLRTLQHAQYSSYPYSNHRTCGYMA